MHEMLTREKCLKKRLNKIVKFKILKAYLLYMKGGVVLLLFLLSISLVSAQYLFGVDVKVTPKIVSTGENVIISTNIKSLGISSDRVDIKVSYKIINENGKLINKSDRTIDISSSTVAIQTSLGTSEIFKIPNDMKSGDYKIVVSVNYQGDEASGSDSFYIAKNTLLDNLNKLVSNNAIILVIIALMILIISIWRIAHHYLTRNKKSRSKVIKNRR